MTGVQTCALPICCVAAYKAAWLASRLTAAGWRVDVVMTDAAKRFVTPLTFASLTGRTVYDSLWEPPQTRTTPREGSVEHIALATRADVALVAPATANTIAKMALGLADNLLTSVLLAYSGPVMVAPGMNEGMWNHPATQAHIKTLRNRGVALLGPVTGRLACGTTGEGRMAEPGDILAALMQWLSNHP